MTHDPAECCASCAYIEAEFHTWQNEFRAVFARAGYPWPGALTEENYWLAGKTPEAAFRAVLLASMDPETMLMENTL